MNSSGTVKHEGIVSKVEGNRITVSFMAQSACGECSAKNLCQISEQKEKEIVIENPSQSFRPGEPVQIIMHSSMGLRAVFLGYVIPFILLIAALAIGDKIFSDELYVGLFGLGVAGMYYLALYLFRDIVSGKFSFTIRKMHE